jgi:hypothetical protein
VFTLSGRLKGENFKFNNCILIKRGMSFREIYEKATVHIRKQRQEQEEFQKNKIKKSCCKDDKAEDRSKQGTDRG